MSRLPRGPKGALLDVAHHSASAEFREEPLIAELMRAEPDPAVFACDVRGGGESQPTTTGTAALESYGPDYLYAIRGLTLDYPYVRQKTHVVLKKGLLNVGWNWRETGSNWEPDESRTIAADLI